MKYSEKQYKLLYEAYEDANRICPHDEYQLKQNRLCRQIAAFLLENYWIKQQEIDNNGT